MFGFKGVSTINNDVAATIITNRPYASLQDFHERMVEVKREVTLSTGKKQMKSLVSSTQTINLIKAGGNILIYNIIAPVVLKEYRKLFK